MNKQIIFDKSFKPLDDENQPLAVWMLVQLKKVQDERNKIKNNQQPEKTA